MGRRVTETEEARPMREEISARDAAAFSRCTEPFRRELLAHCYRMLGSVADAEDLVQETYLRAWRGFAGYSGTSPVRTWLYRIATNACLTALERRGRLALPSGLGGPSEDPDSPLAAGPDRGWLQPIPDALTDAASDDPATVVARREGLRLALIAGLQFLPPRQRAVLDLREVMAFSAAEVATMLDTTVPAVKSTLQRARARLDQVAPAAERIVEPAEPEARALLNRFMKAFEEADPHALAQLLLADITLEATARRTWFAGLDTCLPFLVRHVLGSPGHWRMEPTRANGCPATVAYRRGPDGDHHAYGIVLLTVAPGGIARITSFGDPDLVPLFGLPPVMPAGPSPGLAPNAADPDRRRRRRPIVTGSGDVADR